MLNTSPLFSAIQVFLLKNSWWWHHHHSLHTHQLHWTQQKAAIVIVLEFRIPSSPTNNVLKDSSFRLSTWVLSNGLNIFRAENLVLPSSSHIACHRGILSLSNPFSSHFHQKIIDFGMIHLNECFPQFDVCPNKIGSIISTDHPDISSSANESSQCQYEAISTHAVCSFNMHCSARHTCKNCSIIFSLFATIFNHKWSKHVDTTVGIRWFLGKSI